MKTPDELGGTDEQQAEYAARALRTIRADALSDGHMGRLVSLAGHPPRKLVGIWPRPRDVHTSGSANDGHPRVITLDWGRHIGQSAVTADTEITIHPKEKP